VADIFRGNRDVKIHAVEERMAQAFRQSADQLRRQAYQRDVETHKINMRPEALNEALERVLIGRTAIFIAHRLSTVKNCDRVLVIEGGRSYKTERSPTGASAPVFSAQWSKRTSLNYP
jgi:ABC-type sugar transport system ATPase subunit